ncbi:hypothetical protein G7B40_022870 [Aetokthonos hydrillicola Thurmond2011]|jgi:hypothetical protein|uniref:Uncharacterized protein n=1 Tax=Aetokthonos hydrillicola Thurmond2011 TaxID=2712845 RepID=A0AAP5IC67_9CYAN|nr:hypothetical protein [Aetokthonos hydrillicola]MBO3464490.1 hypothetical protein [Aetokthonos hydrillicola CCALA 1050]MBW4591281.1 hypothetical protein [Aetokthonos hydrillicola CCALA 1050]MDR9897387.1 hypothetical protein [Aetokthonos hydrillicola Thurmond2011]
MDRLSTKDLNRLRSHTKIITNRVEIFIETYLSEGSENEHLSNDALQEIINAANNLTNAVSKMMKTPTTNR